MKRQVNQNTGEEFTIPRKRGRPRKNLDIKSTDSDIEELRGMPGNKKGFWLNTHREEVLSYLEEHGDIETRRHFGIAKAETLDNLKSRWFVGERNKEFTHKDALEGRMLVLEIAIEDLHKEINELKQLFFSFREGVGEQLTNKFFVPLLKAAIKLDPKLEKPEDAINPLSVKYILENNKIKKEKNKW